jgi:polyisoprenoid-binding protein YceI
MLGEENLQSDRFPFVRIHSLETAGDGIKFAAKVEIEMHGQKREIWIPLSVEGLPEKISVTGSFVLRQTDFGARPYTVLNGLIAVQDEVVVDFKLIGG